MMGIATSAGAALGVLGLGGAMRTAIEEFRDARKASRTTAAGIKSIGANTWITTREIEDMSGAIGLRSAMDDEIVQSGANLLLTFGKVRNEVGAGNKIFNRATQAAVDLSARGFGSVDSTAKQLGKALQDPVKGMTALSRAGVTFTKDQKKTIERLVETGQHLKAQKMILGEVEKQVKGTAAAQADPVARAQFAWAELMELLGKQLWPIVGDLSQRFGTFVLQIQRGTGAGGRFRDRVLEVVQGVKDLAGWLNRNKNSIMALGGAVLAGAAAWKAYLIIARVMRIMRTALILLTMWRMGTLSLASAQLLLNGAMIANPIGLVVVAIAALAAGFIIAWKRSEKFREIMTGVWNAVRSGAALMFDVITFGIRQLLTGIGKLAGAAKKIPGLGWLGGVEKAALGGAAGLANISDSIRGGGGDTPTTGGGGPNGTGRLDVRGGASGRSPMSHGPGTVAANGPERQAAGPEVLESNTTVNLDGKKVAKNSQRHAIRKKSTR